MIVDLYLVRFQTELYYISPNIELWKIGNFIGMVGVGFLLYVLDKNILKFRLKGILAYIYLIAGFIALIWPVSTQSGYTLISGIFMFAQLLTIILPVIFINLAIKVPALRNVALIMALGIIIFLSGVILISDVIMGALRGAFGEQIEVLIFFLFFSFKVVGLTLFTYGTAEFSL